MEWKKLPPLRGWEIFGWGTLPHRLPFDSAQGRRSGLTTVAPPALWIERPEIKLPRRNRFDRGVARAYTGAMEIELSPELQAKLDRIASEQGRDTKSLVHEAVERLVGYDEWFLRQVEIGLAQVDRGELLEDKEVAARMENLISRKQRQD